MAPILVSFVLIAIFNVVVIVRHVKNRYQMGPYTFKFFTVMYLLTLAACITGLGLLIFNAVEGS